jgi:hypothetical protein
VTKRLRLIGVLFGCLLSMPRHANAGIIEWIDQMSGPGPFLGFSIEGRLHCFPIGRTDDVYVDGKPRPKPPADQKAALDSYNQRLGVILACPNKLTDGQRPWITLNLAGGVAWALDNNLPYAPGKETGVKLVSLEPCSGVSPSAGGHRHIGRFLLVQGACF